LVTDANGVIGSETFSIVVSAAASGGGNFGWVS
jgi:hypothetical protein